MPSQERAQQEARCKAPPAVGEWIAQHDLAEFGDLGGEGDDLDAVDGRIELSTSHRWNDGAAARFEGDWGRRSMLDGGVLDPMKASQVAHRMAQLWREAQNRRLGEERGPDEGWPSPIKGAVKSHSVQRERGGVTRCPIQASSPPSCLSCGAPLSVPIPALCRRCQDAQDASLTFGFGSGHDKPSARSLSDEAPAPRGSDTQPDVFALRGLAATGDKGPEHFAHAPCQRSSEPRESRRRRVSWFIVSLIICVAFAAGVYGSGCGFTLSKEGPSHAGK